MGYAFLQEYRHGRWCQVQYGSRFLADVETRYATIELELVAVVWAITKCQYQLLGLSHFIVVIDNKPLIPIINSYRLDATQNPILQLLKEKIIGYVFTMKWCRGKLLTISDGLSRALMDKQSPEDVALGEMGCIHVRRVVSQLAAELHNAISPERDIILDRIGTVAPKDPVYVELLDCVTQGFPTACDCLDFEPYWKERDHLYHDGKLMLLGPCIVVTSALRHDILMRLYDSHCGVEVMKCHARQTVWWFEINSDITNVVKACGACQTLQPARCWGGGGLVASGGGGERHANTKSRVRASVRTGHFSLEKPPSG